MTKSFVCCLIIVNGGAFFMKRVASIFIFIVIIITLLPCHVAAWVPSTSFFCQVDTDAVPDGAVYIDLLMPIPSDNEAYIEINQTNADTYGFSKDSEIVKYNQDGFVSYTFHIIDASSDLTISDSIDYNSSIDRISKYDFEYCQKNFKKIKFAYLDKDGNIISTFSNSISLLSDSSSISSSLLNIMDWRRFAWRCSRNSAIVANEIRFATKSFPRDGAMIACDDEEGGSISSREFSTTYPVT